MPTIISQNKTKHLSNRNIADILTKNTANEAVAGMTFFQKLGDKFHITDYESTIRKVFKEIWQEIPVHNNENLHHAILNLSKKCTDVDAFNKNFRLIKDQDNNRQVNLYLSENSIATCELQDEFNPEAWLIQSGSKYYQIDSKNYQIFVSQQLGLNHTFNTPNADTIKDACFAIKVITSDQINEDFKRIKAKVQIEYKGKIYKLVLPKFEEKSDIDEFLNSVIRSNKFLDVTIDLNERNQIKNLLIISLCQSIQNPLPWMYQISNPHLGTFKPTKNNTLKNINISLTNNAIYYKDLKLDYVETFGENGKVIDFNPDNQPSINTGMIEVKITSIQSSNNLVSGIYDKFSIANISLHTTT